MYYTVEDGNLVETRSIEIDCTDFKVHIVQPKYEMSAKKDKSKFLIDFEIIPGHRDTIVCTNSSQVLVALGIVRQAFDNFPEKCKS